MLALRLPEEIEGRLNALAKKTGRTKSLYVREDIYLAEKRLEDLQAGRSRTTPTTYLTPAVPTQNQAQTFALNQSQCRQDRWFYPQPDTSRDRPCLLSVASLYLHHQL